MKKIIISIICALIALSSFADDFNTFKKELIEKIEKQKTEIKITKLHLKNNKSNDFYKVQLKSQKDSLKILQNDYEIIINTIKAKETYINAEKLYNKTKIKYEDFQNKYNQIKTKY